MGGAQNKVIDPEKDETEAIAQKPKESMFIGE